jgi:hypothetical protein
MKNIIPARWLIVLFLFTLVGPATPGTADTLILHSGEEFNTKQIWEEGDIIRFSMHGLKVSVQKKDVKEIIRDAGGQAAPALVDADIQTVPYVVDAEKPFGEPHPSWKQPVDNNTLKKVSIPPSTPPAGPSMPMTRSVIGTGLNGLFWKAPPNSIAGLVKIATEPSYGGIDQYQRPWDDPRMGQTQLDGMIYGFWRDQLYIIMMWVEGRPRYQRLKETVNVYFGTGRQSASGIERYIWRDNDTDRLLEFDEKLNTGIFWMRSKSLDILVKRMYPE